jgi:hypothetical protein
VQVPTQVSPSFARLLAEGPHRDAPSAPDSHLVPGAHSLLFELEHGCPSCSLPTKTGLHATSNSSSSSRQDWNIAPNASTHARAASAS